MRLRSLFHRRQDEVGTVRAAEAVRAARIRGVSPPPVDMFGFERYPETVRRLKACVEGAATDARG